MRAPFFIERRTEMKNYTIYVCEECKFETRDLQEMKEHEAAHLGLTVEQHDEYKKLKQDAASAGALIAIEKNEKTEERFDDAIRALIKFEEEHLIRKSKKAMNVHQ